jgi:hypothetical protein
MIRPARPVVGHKLSREGRVKRAFLFGLAVQLFVVGVAFLFLGDLMLPMTRSPLIGVVALVLGVACGVFAWRLPPHPKWLVTISCWIAGFLALYVAIPVIEIVAVIVIAVMN